MSISKVNDLNVYKVAFKLAMDIFHITVKFPKEEKYSLTDQIRRSSRSISINIAEDWGKILSSNDIQLIPWVHWRKLKDG